MPRADRVRWDRLPALIAGVYRVADDERHWMPFLLDLSDAVHGTTVLLLHDLHRSGSLPVAVRHSDEGVRLYGVHYAALDPRAINDATRRLIVPGRALPDDVLCPYDRIAGTEYYDFAIEYEVSRLMTIALERHAGGVTALSVTRSHARGPFGDDALALLEAVASHAERVLRLRRHLTTPVTRHDAAVHALDAVRTGILFASADGRVRHANREARRLLAERDGLSAPGGRLAGATAARTQALLACCAQAAACAAGDGHSAGGTLLLPRPSGRRPLQVAVQPAFPSDGFAPQRQDAAVLVFVNDPEHDPLPRAALLQRVYGFTRTEARFAAHLATGESLEEIAAQFRYTRETARWYARQVLAKTGCRSRAAFVRLVALTVAGLDVLNGQNPYE